MNTFRFGPAQAGETIVYGAQRPGYNSNSVGDARLHQWIAFMIENGIQRVCCLLPPDQLRYYSSDLLEEYRRFFGASNVCSAAVPDYHLCDQHLLETLVLPFLARSVEAAARVVVHCSGGSGRTGHVLAAWLVRYRGLSVGEALDAVVATGRDPREAIWCRNATEDELRRLLAGPEKAAI